MNENMDIRAYEDLVLQRVLRAFDGIDNGNADYVDDVLDSIEMLFKLKPHLQAELEKAKTNLALVAQQSFLESYKRVAAEEDELSKQFKQQQDSSRIKWGYRKDLLEAILNIMNNNQLIPFKSPTFASIDSVKGVKTASIPVEEEEPEPEPEPIPVQAPVQPQQQHTYTRPNPQLFDEVSEAELSPDDIKRAQEEAKQLQRRRG